ncbi:MAG: isochorismatase family protein [Alphaproteobacteria bacterium]|nr:isochorismatase family protein [Alphaproteobacteria bacterium]
MSIEDRLKRAESLDVHCADSVSVPRDCSFVLVVDAQARLMPAIAEADSVLDRLERLVRIARLLGVPIRATEHCADKIGSTVPPLALYFNALEILEKRHFDATREEATGNSLSALVRPVAVVAGVETHVCVAQTALGLMRHGWRVAVVQDACGSRRVEDREAGLARLRLAGAIPVTVEALAFEWLETADHPDFREALSIVKA